MKKRVFAMVLSLLLCLNLFPPAFAMTGVKVTQKGQVVDSITFNGVTVNAIYAPRATVSNYGSDATYSCAAFVKKFYQQVYGVSVSNLLKNGGGPKASKGSFSVTTSPQVGDVVHRKTDTSTHWSIVKAVNGSTITLIEQNGWYKKAEDKARVGKTYDLSTDKAVTVYRYSGAGSPEPKPEVTPEPAPAPAPSFDTTTVTIRSFDLVYHANGGEDAPASVWKSSDQSAYTHVISDQRPTRSGYTFLGWSAKEDSASPDYQPGDSLTASGATHLYAVWEADCKNGHTWGAWKTTVQPGCETAGARQRTCSVCGETDREDIEAPGHDYRVKQNAPTYTLYVCANCGDSYVEGKEIIDKDPEDEDLPDQDPENETPEDEEPSAGSFDNFQLSAVFYDGLFQDVSPKDWFYGNVATVYSLGLMKGTGKAVFSPGSNVTLAEAVTLAARIHSIYTGDGETFSGYDGGNWYDPYVNYARDKGIITENYAYSRPATREEFVHILARALPQEALETTVGQVAFADRLDITYMADVRLLSGAGIINGVKETGQTWFKPLEPVTRSQMAAIAGRMTQPDTRIGR